MKMSEKTVKTRESLVNLSMDYDLLCSLKDHAKDKGVEKVSDYVQYWLRNLGFDKKDIKRVVLQIPDEVFTSKSALADWLKRRSDEIVNHYFKGN